MKRLAQVLLFLVLSSGSLRAVHAAEIKLADDLGNEVAFTNPPQRIVSLAPSNTELLFAIGLGGKLVGVTDYCNFPEAANKIERVAGFNTLSAEKVVAVKPDLVVASRGNDQEGVETLRKLGIPVFVLDIQTLDQMLTAVERLGKLGGVEAPAARVKKDLAGRVEQVRKRVATQVERPKVMWGYWGEPVYTAGPRTMIDDVFSTAGGTNVARQATEAWPQVGLETIVAWAPEVIIASYPPQLSDPEKLKEDLQQLRQRAGWKEVPAVKQGRIYYIDGDLLNRPGPRLVDALEQVAALLHPQDAGGK